MRRAAVSVVLTALGAALVFFLVTRERAPLPAAKATTAHVEGGPDATTDPTKDATDSTPEAPATGGDKKEVGGATAAAPSTKPLAKVALGRPLRVISHGWDLVVPGLVAKAKGEFAKRGLEVEFRSANRLADIEAALAAGGTADKGADVAIVALPLLALTYEDLSALQPELFWVIGYSRGRDALYAEKADLVAPPSNKLTLVGDPERASTFFSLFALDLAGVDVAKVTIISPDDPKRAGATFAAVDRSLPSADRLKGARKLLLSTNDAADLVPYVAVAPHGFLEQNTDSATAFGAAWLAGVDELRRDVPAAARSVAALEGTPEPVVLIKRLGQLEFVDLADNARLLGLSGRGAVSAHALFRTSFRLWREAGVISTAAPVIAPIAPAAVSTLVFGKGAPPRAPTKAMATQGAEPILVARLTAADEDRAIEQIGTVAGLFPRSVIEVGYGGRAKMTEMAIARAAERFGIDPSRLVAAPKRAKRGSGTRAPLTLAIMPIP